MSGLSGRDVLELDELLCDRARRDQVEAARTVMPVGQRDQVEAASRATIAGAVRHALNVPLRGQVAADFAELPGWLRLGVLSVLVQFVSGTARTCVHEPTITAPVPIFGCAWVPDAYTCVPCAPMLFPQPGTATDHTCDVCGLACPPGDRCEGLNITTYYVGILTYMAGLCPDCVRDLTGAGS